MERLRGESISQSSEHATPSQDLLALPTAAMRSIVRYRDGSVTQELDTIATEYALTIFVNDEEMATVVCTPEHMEDLVLGFLASEGVIRTVDQVEQVAISRFRGTARVRTDTAVTFNQAFYNKRHIASCCGKSRQSFYFVNDAHMAKPVEDSGLIIQPEAVLELIHRMESSSDTFHATGGVHTASLCTVDGVVLSRSDIGRHNALDKLYGHCLRHRLTTSQYIIAFSGRLSSEVLLKVAKMGIGVVLAKSAPTVMALDMADELNVTAIGFVRDQGFNIYTHPWRLRLGDIR